MTSGYQVLHFFNNLAPLNEITALEQVSFTNPWSCKSLSTEIASPLNLTSIISLQSAAGLEVIGYSLTRIIAPEAELLRVAVKPEMHRQGAATKILAELLLKLITFQVEKVYLEVSEKNLSAIALYQKAGFSNSSYRPNYYDAGATGALIFESVVPNSPEDLRKPLKKWISR